MARWSFETKLVRPAGVGTWTFAPIPFDLAEEVGVRARIRVKGTVDGKQFHCSLLPAGGGKHFIVVKKELRDAIGKKNGERVKVEMDLDSTPVVVAVPDDLARALAKNKRAAAYLEKIAPSHRKAYVNWINAAKKPETRKARIERAIAMLAAGKVVK